MNGQKEALLLAKIGLILSLVSILFTTVGTVIRILN